MPKHQPTAAQAARNDTRSGGKYTTALRARQATTKTPGTHVLQFLAERSGNLHQLVGGIAAALAHSGQRVLLLQEVADYWELAFIRRGRKKPQPVASPEPETIVLWESPSDRGTLARHTCMWETRGKARPTRGFPERDRSLLQAAVNAARPDYDLIVLMPYGGWAYPVREAATTFVALGEVDDFPHTDCRVFLPESREERGVPLSPEQSAAVLRDRCLSFLFNHLPVPLDGLIWQSQRKLPVDAAYLAAIDRDMDRVGLRPLGWVTHERWPAPYQQLPEPEQLQDPGFVQPYRPIAARLRTAIDSRPARASQLATS
ncbi:hypothetical protein [Streptomyces sp. NPDC048644]|uniref:hypothetical protein n=1 Tax=Streptomyces sp. NPDC048644 TaxID=3365582 RepID=UPI00370FCD2A